MSENFEYISKDVAKVRAKIDSAALKYGRDPKEITLLAAIKYADTDEVNYLHKCAGITVVGENRVQQLIERYEALDKEDLSIHFIGSLQTNKVKYIVDKVDMIHSLDSERLAYEIDRQCAKIGKTMKVLCEINCGREENKSGILPEDAEEFCLGLSKYKNIELCGFMTMAPASSDFDDYRKYFSETVKLVLDIWHKKLHNIERPVISMGMSGSFEAAIAEGSTIVRIGRSLFAKE
jgi:pyridoxal phosphate enzyme (YggS family)